MWVHHGVELLLLVSMLFLLAIPKSLLILKAFLYTIYKGCVKMFPPKTRADVGMVQCVSEGHGKPPGRKNVGTRRRASLSMQTQIINIR